MKILMAKNYAKLMCAIKLHKVSQKSAEQLINPPIL